MSSAGEQLHQRVDKGCAANRDVTACCTARDRLSVQTDVSRQAQTAGVLRLLRAGHLNVVADSLLRLKFRHQLATAELDAGQEGAEEANSSPGWIGE